MKRKPKNSKHNFNEVIDIKMRKKQSPHMVKFYTDPEDPHFCVAELVKLKDRAIKCRHYFLRSDLNQFISMYRNDGFYPVDDDSANNTSEFENKSNN